MKATTCNIAENKRNVLSHNICSTNIFDREQTSCNMIQQHATWYNNTQQGGQTVQTFSWQQMLHVVAWKVGIVWPGLKEVHFKKTRHWDFWKSKGTSLSPGQTIPTFHATTCNICCQEKVCTVWPPCCVLLYHVACCCIMFHEVCSRSKMFVEQMLRDRTFLLFSAMLHVVAFVWPPSQTLLCSRLRSGILISRNYRLNPLFTFNLYLSGFKSLSVKQNLRIVIQLPLICRSSRLCCKMTQNIMYQKILNNIHGVAENVSLDHSLCTCW